MTKDGLGFVGILREALRIPTASPKFLILAFLSSFPLFCSLLLNELLIQQTTSSDSRGFNICCILGPISVLKRWVEGASQGLVLMSALYLVVVNLLDLLNTISAGILSTTLVLSCLTFLGLFSLASNLYGLSSYFGPVGFSRVLSGVLFVALFAKYMEWNAIWNIGFVISILEEKHGDVALGVAAYLSRGSRRKGLALVLVVFIWRLALGLSCLYFAWRSKGSGLVATIVLVSRPCLGNVVKWSVFMVCYRDCKRRFLVKNIDVEEGKAA
ncbi:hypothetical protein BT93_J1927 [Corymbia citriodora subsp. variegata]|nr:hypothetical protein BT93_J1927 [Corymbia citriodora subsp. variegata]